MEVKFIKTHSDVKSPTRAYAHDAGWDLYAAVEVVLPPYSWSGVPLGICIQLPSEQGYIWEAQIRPRSSHRGKGVLVTLGTIDQGYRGQLGGIVFNFSSGEYVVKEGEKIAQLIVTRFPEVTFLEVDRLDSSERGEKGFGSSGI